MKINNGKHYDILVCGCGSAGFCAAVQAARAGMKTAVVEKYGMPGGVMTVMGNPSVDQFNNPFRSENKMVIQGIGWEFVNELAGMGYAAIPDMNAEYKNHWMYGVKVNPVAAAKLMDDYLLREGVDLYYNQSAVSVETAKDGEGRRIGGILLSTKDGLKRLTAKMVIDCTGDGDICAWAGAPYECGDEETGELQPGTLRFYPDSGCVDSHEADRVDRLIAQAKEQGQLSSEDLFNNELLTILDRSGDNFNHIPHFNSADSDSKTEAEIRGRRSLLRVMDVLQCAGTSAKIISCAPEVAPRESRRILCDGYILCEEYMSGMVYKDSVCYSYWFVDLHRYGEKAHIVYLTEGQTPTIPLSAMIPKGLTNAYVAGRCISSDRLANSGLRVKASCMAMGQAVGAAAAVAVRENSGKNRGTDLGRIKALLAEHGAIVPGLTEPKAF